MKISSIKQAWNYYRENNIDKSTLKKVAVYIRADDEETSLQEICMQRIEIYSYCINNGLYPVLECGDIWGGYGIQENCDSLKKLIEEADKEKEWDAILVYEYNRIADDIDGMLELHYSLHSKGVDLLDVYGSNFAVIDKWYKEHIKKSLKVKRNEKNS